MFILTACSESSRSRTDLAGKWSINTYSRRRFPQLRNCACAIDLNSDSTFHLKQIPGELFDQPGSSISGDGRWALREADRSVRLDLRTITAGDERRVPFSTTLRVVSSRKTILRFFIGDPDDMNTIDFTKQ